MFVIIKHCCKSFKSVLQNKYEFACFVVRNVGFYYLNYISKTD